MQDNAHGCGCPAGLLAEGLEDDLAGRSVALAHGSVQQPRAAFVCEEALQAAAQECHLRIRRGEAQVPELPLGKVWVATMGTYIGALECFSKLC